MGTRKALFGAVDRRRFCAEDGIYVAGVHGAADEVGVDLVLDVAVVTRRDDAVNQVRGDIAIEGRRKSFSELSWAVGVCHRFCRSHC